MTIGYIPRWAAVGDAAMADPAAHTAAFIVVHKGEVVCERYGLGTGRTTQLESWSMAGLRRRPGGQGFF